MLIYLLVISILFCCVLVFDVKGRHENRKLWERVILVTFILLAGLRNHVGSDSIAYEYSFYSQTLSLKDFFQIKNLENMREPIWAFFMCFCKTFFGSFVVFQFIHAIIINVLLYRFFKKTTEKVFSALFIVFLVFWFEINFEVLRQSLCLALFLNAILLLREKKITAYMILSVAMFGIHNFSIVILIITPFVLYTKPKIFYPVLVLVTIYVFFFVDENLMNMLFAEVEDLANENIQYKINSYVNYGNYGYINLNVNGIIKLLTLSVFFPLSIISLSNAINSNRLCRTHKHSDNAVQIDGTINKFILLYLFFGLLSSKMVIIFRLQEYFVPFIIVASVNVSFKIRKKTILGIIFYLLFFIFTIDAVVTLYKPSPLVISPVSYDTRYFPYTSIFEEENFLRKKMWGR